MADIYPWSDICPDYVRQTSHEGYVSRGIYEYI